MKRVAHMTMKHEESTDNQLKAKAQNALDWFFKIFGTVDDASGVMFAVNRAANKGLFFVGQFGYLMNSPLMISVLFIPSILITFVATGLHLFNQAKEKRSLHSRIMEVVTGAAIIALSIAALAGVTGMILPMCAIGFFKGLWNLTTHVSSLLFGKKKIEVAQSAVAARENAIDVINKVHNIVIGGLTLTAAIFLFFPPLAPIGAAILLATAIYSLAATVFESTVKVNPFKWAMQKISNAIFGEPKDEPKAENPKPMTTAKIKVFIAEHNQLGRLLNNRMVDESEDHTATQNTPVPVVEDRKEPEINRDTAPRITF